MTTNTLSGTPSNLGQLLFEATHNGDLPAARLLLEAHPELIHALNNYSDNYPLHEAAKWGEGAIAELLLQLGADPNQKGQIGRTPLHYAPVNHRPEVVELLLSHGADPNIRDEWGLTPLFYVNTKRAAELLIAAGADPLVQKSGKTPLHAATVKGPADLVEYLISQGCNVNARDNRREAPLHRAAQLGRIDIAEMLLVHGAKPNLMDRIGRMSGFGCTPLYEATSNGHREMVDLLLRSGAKLKRRSGLTPMHIAARGNDIPMLAHLIARGFDVNAADKEGVTPLHEVCDMAENPDDSLPVLQFLLDQRANPNLRDHKGDTPLHAAIRQLKPYLAEFLLCHGATPDGFTAAALGNVDNFLRQHSPIPDAIKTVNQSDETLLHWSAMTGNIYSLRYLLENGADINAQDRDGNTPLHHAAFNKQLGAIEMLLQHNADVNRPDLKGVTPLMCATDSGEVNIAILLACKGADVNAQDVEGWCALHIAACDETATMVGVLLSLNARINPVTATGPRTSKRRTPLDLATRYKTYQCHAIIALLKAHGAKRGSTLKRHTKS